GDDDEHQAEDDGDREGRVHPAGHRGGEEVGCVARGVLGPGDRFDLTDAVEHRGGVRTVGDRDEEGARQDGASGGGGERVLRDDDASAAGGTGEAVHDADHLEGEPAADGGLEGVALTGAERGGRGGGEHRRHRVTTTGQG